METRELGTNAKREHELDESQKLGANQDRFIVLLPEELEQMIKAAGREGAKQGVEAYRKAEEKAKEERAEKVRNSAKTLLIHYRQLKIMKKTSVVDANTVTDPTLREILEGLAGRIRRNEFELNSTTRNKIKTGMIMNHVDVMLENYRKECKRSRVPEVERRYRVVEAMYLREDRLKVSEVAELEGIEPRTVYMTLDKAYDDLTILIWGIDGMEAVENKRIMRTARKRSRAGKA